MSDGSVSPRLLADVLEDGVSRRRFLARTSAATAVIAAGCGPRSGGPEMDQTGGMYERADISTDTASFLDRGTFGVDPVHPAFSDLEAVNNGSVDAHDAFTRAQGRAAPYGLAVAPSPGTYHVASNLSISSPLQLHHGAMLKPASGVTITISGHLDAPAHEQVFDLSAGGTVVLDSGQLHNVRWWGASPSAAAADNATALQATIDSAVRQSRVARIYVPAGLYPYSTTLTVPDTHGNVMAHVIFVGEGAPNLVYDGNPDPAEISGSILHYTPADGTHAIAYQLTGLTSSITAFTFEDIQLNGPESPSSGDGVRLIGDHDNARLVRVAFKNFCVRGFAGGNGVYLEFCENGGAVNLTSCRNKYGVTLTNAANSNSFLNLVTQYNTHNALRVLDCVSVHVFGGLCQHQDRNGYYFNGADEVTVNGIHFEANNVTSPEDFYAVHIQGTDGFSNSRISFYGCRFAGFTDRLYIEGVATGVSAHTSFIGCRSMARGDSLTIADTSSPYTLVVPKLGGTIRDTSATLTQLDDLALLVNYLRFQNPMANPPYNTPSVYHQAGVGLTLSAGAVEVRAGSTPARQLIVEDGRVSFEANYLEGVEIAAPAAPRANRGRLYFRDNGSGKTQLVAVFSSGAVQVIATQP